MRFHIRLPLVVLTAVCIIGGLTGVASATTPGSTAPSIPTSKNAGVWVSTVGKTPAIPGALTRLDPTHTQTMTDQPGFRSTGTVWSAGCAGTSPQQAFSRLAACTGVLGWSFNHYSRINGNLVLTGSISGILINYAQLSIFQTSWKDTLRILPTIGWGDASSGNYVTTQATCTTGCRESFGTAQVPLSLNVWKTLDVGITANPLAVGQQAKMKFSIDEVFDNIPTEGAALSTGGLFPEIRCDNGVAWGGSQGCVFDGAWSGNVYSKSDPKVGPVAIHVDAAQKSQLNHPGQVSAARVPIGSALHRTTNALTLASNESKKNSTCAKTTPHPAGWDCDEYPYRSTVEGGGSGNAFSVKYVPATENRVAGGQLGSMYKAARVMNGDAFYTLITP